MKKNKEDIKAQVVEEVREEDILFKKTIKILIILSIVFLFFAVGYFSVAKPTVSNRTYNVFMNNYQVKSSASSALNILYGGKSYTKALDEVHKMSHNVVVSGKQWGRLPLTEERINKLILQAHGSSWNVQQKKELLNILNKWKAGNFTSAHEDHNLVWRKLEGNVGRATGVNYNGVPKWAREKFNYSPYK